MLISLALAEAVWERSTHRGAALLVLLALADYANRQGEAWPKIDSLARKARMSRRYCTALLQQLAESGEISIDTLSQDRRRRLFRLVAFLPALTAANSSSTTTVSSSRQAPQHNPSTAQGEARNNGPEPSNFDIDARLQALADLLPNQLPERERWQQQLLEIHGELEQVEARLEQLEDEILEGLQSQLDSKQQERIRQDVSRRLQPLAHRLPTGELTYQRERHFQLELRELFKLPRLSLFSPALDEVFGS